MSCQHQDTLARIARQEMRDAELIQDLDEPAGCVSRSTSESKQGSRNSRGALSPQDHAAAALKAGLIATAGMGGGETELSSGFALSSSTGLHCSSSSSQPSGSTAMTGSQPTTWLLHSGSVEQANSTGPQQDMGDTAASSTSYQPLMVSTAARAAQAAQQQEQQQQQSRPILMVDSSTGAVVYATAADAAQQQQQQTTQFLSLTAPCNTFHHQPVALALSEQLHMPVELTAEQYQALLDASSGPASAELALPVQSTASNALPVDRLEAAESLWEQMAASGADDQTLLSLAVQLGLITADQTGSLVLAPEHAARGPMAGVATASGSHAIHDAVAGQSGSLLTVVDQQSSLAGLLSMYASAGVRPQGTPRSSAGKHALYKTELCKGWLEAGSCRYGSRCQFAHGPTELRPIPRHPKYKTEVCRSFAATGMCAYGSRCRFIHGPISAPCNLVDRTLAGLGVGPGADTLEGVLSFEDSPHIQSEQVVGRMSGSLSGLSTAGLVMPGAAVTRSEAAGMGVPTTYEGPLSVSLARQILLGQPAPAQGLPPAARRATITDQRLSSDSMSYPRTSVDSSAYARVSLESSQYGRGSLESVQYRTSLDSVAPVLPQAVQPAEVYTLADVGPYLSLGQRKQQGVEVWTHAHQAPAMQSVPEGHMLLAQEEPLSAAAALRRRNAVAVYNVGPMAGASLSAPVLTHEQLASIASGQLGFQASRPATGGVARRPQVLTTTTMGPAAAGSVSGAPTAQWFTTGQ